MDIYTVVLVIVAAVICVIILKQFLDARDSQQITSDAYDSVFYDDARTDQSGINPLFRDMQYHDDYKDTIDALNVIDPMRRDTFNLAALPIVYKDTMPADESESLAQRFIEAVNRAIKQGARNPFGSGIGDNPDRLDGWADQMKKLGLPPSIHAEPAKACPIRLVSIDKAEKFETEDEIRCVLYLVVQKSLGTNVQMIVKASFVIGTRNVNIDRDNNTSNDFEYSNDESRTPIRLEKTDVVGFLFPAEPKMHSHRQNAPIDDKRFDAYEHEYTDGHTLSKVDIAQILAEKKRIDATGHNF